MSVVTQTPYQDEDLFLNPEQRCPCVLVLDTSASMMDKGKLDALNDGLRHFERCISNDRVARNRVEVSIVTFGGTVQELQSFATIDRCNFPSLTCSGNTPMGEAVEKAISLVNNRRRTLMSSNVPMVRPWIWMITDGLPTDKWTTAAKKIEEGERNEKFSFFAIGVDDADIETLEKLSVRPPAKLNGIQFEDMFLWLSVSLSTASGMKPGEATQLEPTTNWGAVAA